MQDRKENPKIEPISEGKLSEIAKKDLNGYAKALDLVLSDQTDLFFTQNQSWPFKDEFQDLLEKGGNRTAEQESRFNTILTKLLLEMKMSRQRLEEMVLQTYANQNN